MFTICVSGSYPKQPEAPRPQLLNTAIEKHTQGLITDKELTFAKDRAMVEIAVELVAAGVEVINDGLLKWDDEYSYICAGLSGFEVTAHDSSSNGKSTVIPPRAKGRIAWRRPVISGDYQFLSERSPVEVRPSMTGPFSIARAVDPGDYGSDIHGLTRDLAIALNRELEGLEAVDAKHILVEEPLLTQYKDEIDFFTEITEILLKGITVTVTLGTSSGDLVGIDAQLRETSFKGFSFDLLDGPENERVLSEKDLWEDRIIQLGLVHGQKTRIESPMEVALGLVKYAAFHDPGLIWVAPTSGMVKLPRNVAFQKLVNAAEGVDWARKEMARREEPGGKLPQDG